MGFFSIAGEEGGLQKVMGGGLWVESMVVLWFPGCSRGGCRGLCCPQAPEQLTGQLRCPCQCSWEGHSHCSIWTLRGRCSAFKPIFQTFGFQVFGCFIICARSLGIQRRLRHSPIRKSTGSKEGARSAHICTPVHTHACIGASVSVCM